MVRRPWLVLLIGVLAVSFAALFIRLSTAPPLAIAFWRMSLAFLVQAPFLLRPMRREALPARGRPLALSVVVGLALAAHFAAWITSLRLTTVASSTVLVATQPMWVAAGAFLLWRERVSPLQGAALLLALAGTAVIGWGDLAHGSLPGAKAAGGDLLAILGAIFMAVYFLAGRLARATLSLGTYTFVAYGTAAVALLAVCAATGVRLAPYPWRDWLAFLGLAVLCTLGGHSLLNWALRHLSPTAVSASILGEPVGATLWAFILLGERPSPLQVAGGLAVLVGLALYAAAPSWLAGLGPAREQTPGERQQGA